MKQLKDGFADRQKAAAEAKARLLKKFAAAPKPDDPEMLAKRAEREAIAAAREARQAERDRLKREEAERVAAEKAAVEAAEAAEKALADEQHSEEAKARKAALKEEQKAERDRRYAARKARKR